MHTFRDDRNVQAFLLQTIIYLGLYIFGFYL